MEEQREYTPRENYERIERIHKRDREREKQRKKALFRKNLLYLIGEGHFNNNLLRKIYKGSFWLAVVCFLWLVYHFFILMFHNPIDFSYYNEHIIDHYGYWLIYNIAPPFFFLFFLILLCGKLIEVDKGLKK